MRCCRVQMLARSAAGVCQSAAASSQARLAVQSPQLTDVVAGWLGSSSRTWWEDSQTRTEQRKDREAVITVLSPRAAPQLSLARPNPILLHSRDLRSQPGLAWLACCGRLS